MRKSDKRILVVEDDEAAIHILTQALKFEGYTVEQAMSAEEAFNKIREFKPHLVLTDHDMPGVSGLDMLNKLRENKNYVTIIFVSGRNEVPKVVQALRSGADDYIRKPYDVPELLARVDASLRNNEIHRDLYEANLKLNEMVELDFLTGLLNMRSMYQRIDQALKIVPQGRAVACVMMDMDKFKRVNDDHDHLFGSYVLKEVGALIKKSIRSTDYAARYGGDEFLIVLSSCVKKEADDFCDRLRREVESAVFADSGHSMKLTISMGYSLSTDHAGFDARKMVRKADENLYKAKELGRNRVISS